MPFCCDLLYDLGAPIPDIAIAPSQMSKTASIMSNIVVNYGYTDSSGNHYIDEKSYSKAISSFCSIIEKAANNKP
jgi:hypothetical protein